MKTASVSETKDRLSALIRQVQSGDSVVITDRGVPVAELVPVRLGSGMPARIVALGQEGRVRLPEQSPDAEWLDLPRPAPSPGPSVVDVLLEERADGR